MGFGFKKMFIVMFSSVLVMVLAFSVTFYTVDAVLGEESEDNANTDDITVIESNDDYDLIINNEDCDEPSPEKTEEDGLTESEGYVIEIIEDEYVPKAMRVEEHSDCALHFLIPVAALLVQIYYIFKRKNYQREMFELRKKLSLCDED